MEQSSTRSSSAVNHQQVDGEASAAQQATKFVIFRQDSHKPHLSEAYREPTKSRRKDRAPTSWKSGELVKQQSSHQLTQALPSTGQWGACQPSAVRPSRLAESPSRLLQLRLTCRPRTSSHCCRPAVLAKA